MKSESRARVIKAQLISSGAVRLTLRQRAAFADAEGIRSDAEELRQAAREQGYADGLAEGRTALAAQALALRAEAAKLRASSGNRLIKLGISLAERILSAELQTSPSALEALAAQTLAEARWCSTLVLRLHPKDADHLREAAPRLAGLLEPDAELVLEADPALAPGSCVVETPSGELDGSIPVRLAALEEALLGEEPDHG